MTTSLSSQCAFGRAGQLGVYVSGTALIRAGGLPMSLLDGLRSETVTRLLDRYLEVEESLEALKTIFTDLLHDEISLLSSGDAHRSSLLELRRDVYNRRPLRPHAIAQESLSPKVQECLERWKDVNEELAELMRQGLKALSSETASKRLELKQIAQIDHFRRGLLLSSPVFERKLDEYIASGAAVLDRKLRRTERTLLLYLTRTCYKTTPFSTLTPIGLACFEAGDSTASIGLIPELPAFSLTCRVRPNLGLLSRLSEGLRGSIDRLESSHASLKDGWSLEGDRVKYLRRVVTPLTRGGPLHCSIDEREFWIPNSPSLQAVVRFLLERETAPIREIYRSLSGVLASPLESKAFVGLLLSLDFLVLRGLRISVFDEECWSHYIDSLKSNVLGPDADEIRVLSEIEALVSRYDSAEVGERRTLLRECEGMGKDLLAAVPGGEHIPQPAFYEDAAFRLDPTPLDARGWQRHLDDLAKLQRILPVFDSLTVSRMAMSALFVKIYGAGGQSEDLLSFAQFFAEAYYRPFQEAVREAADSRASSTESTTPNPFDIEAIRSMDAARSMLWSRIVGLLNTDEGKYEIELPAELIEDVMALLPVPQQLSSHSFFCQLCHSDEEEKVVLNRVYGGMTSMYSRFCHLFPEHSGPSLADRLRSTLNDLQPEGSIYAEIQGSHDNNLNQHPVLTDFELLCPGEVATKPGEAQVRLEDLEIRHNPATDTLELFSKRLNRQVIPLYLGFLYPLVLPELHQILLHFSPSSFIRPQFWPLEWKDQEARSVLFRPRIRYRSVVLERAQWHIPVNMVPRRQQGEGDFEYVVTMTRWFRAQGIPIRFFLTSTFAGGKGGGAEAGSEDVAQKPVYIDLMQVFGLFLFEKILQDSVGVMIAVEPLPDNHHAALQFGGERYVSEYVLEISQGGLRRT